MSRHNPYACYCRTQLWRFKGHLWVPQCRAVHDTKVYTVACAGERHRDNVLQTLGATLQAWIAQVKREKAIYHVLNKCSVDVTRKVLVAEAWCPVSAKPRVHEALREAAHSTSASVSPLFLDPHPDMSTIEPACCAVVVPCLAVIAALFPFLLLAIPCSVPLHLSLGQHTYPASTMCIFRRRARFIPSVYDLKRGPTKGTEYLAGLCVVLIAAS